METYASNQSINIPEENNPMTVNESEISPIGEPDNMDSYGFYPDTSF